MPSLEIGPGKKRQPGFITVDVDPAADVDHVCNAVDNLPFQDGRFRVVFASHVLEHLPWYQSLQAVVEWVRVMGHGARLEVWVPNGYKVAKAMCRFEEVGDSYGMQEDGWFRSNPDKDPYLWANGRIFTYGDGKGEVNHPNWHRTLFSPKSVVALLQQAGLKDVRLLDPKKERRGPSHGWIDMGVVGVKP